MNGGLAIAVRPAEPGDAPALVALAESVGREEGRWILSGEWRSAPDERRYLKLVRRHPDAVVLVAEVDGAVVGRLSLARDPHPASGHVADLGLMVDARHRRSGVGRALLEHAVGWARRAGIRKLELHVFPWNEPALALYESFGFAREGYRIGHYLRDGEYVDAVLMAYAVPREKVVPAAQRPVSAVSPDASSR
jgi:RimJ/RimL family protein N-acetyltransferase